MIESRKSNKGLKAHFMVLFRSRYHTGYGTLPYGLKIIAVKSGGRQTLSDRHFMLSVFSPTILSSSLCQRFFSYLEIIT